MALINLSITGTKKSKKAAHTGRLFYSALILPEKSTCFWGPFKVRGNQVHFFIESLKVDLTHSKIKTFLP